MGLSLAARVELEVRVMGIHQTVGVAVRAMPDAQPVRDAMPLSSGRTGSGYPWNLRKRTMRQASKARIAAIGRYTYGKTPALMAQLEIEYADGSRETDRDRHVLEGDRGRAQSRRRIS